ncbi:unnamed protein product [Vicia faba]|uniref:Uncharacterized protein n=1 Tax=Vicia faba TaxID=3906 RepID=A0AAV1A7T1_VICFA|nr:unnamed protein product [Vicia faba]
MCHENILSDMLKWSQMYKENDDHVHEDVEVETVIANDGIVNNHDHEVENVETTCGEVISKDGNLRMVCSVNRKNVSNYATDKYGIIKKGEYVEVEDLPFANIMNRIIENLMNPHDKATQEKEHVMINMNDNIDDSIDANEGFIPKNNDVHEGYEPVNKCVTKDVGLWKMFDKKSRKMVDSNKIPTNISITSLYNMSFHYEKRVLK